ncbi:MAG: hypothetical protein HFG48_02325 [Bacilli bacterium]|nr:hypothetical protein [Bacilli bacterium]
MENIELELNTTKEFYLKITIYLTAIKFGMEQQKPLKNRLERSKLSFNCMF